MISAKRYIKSILPAIGALAGALIQLLTLIISKKVLESEEFILFLLVLTIANSAAIIASANKHASHLIEKIGNNDLIRSIKKCILLLPVSTAIIITVEGGGYENNYTRIAVIFISITSISIAKLYGLFKLAKAIRENRKKDEFIARTGSQILLLLAITLAERSLEWILLATAISQLVFIGYYKLQECAETPSVNALSTSHTSSNTLLLTLHTISDSVVAPVLITAWAAAMPSDMAAAITFYFRFASSAGGVVSSAYSMYAVKYNYMKNLSARYSYKRLLATVIGLYLIIGFALSRISDNPLFLPIAAITIWQIIMAYIGIKSLIPNIFGRQNTFSILSIIMNGLLLAGSLVVALNPLLEGGGVLFYVSLAPALAMLVVIDRWIASIEK